MDKNITKTSKNNTKTSNIWCFSAINPYIEEWKVKLEEKEITGKKFISYGADNHFPDYLLDLYRNVASLRTIIDTYVTYICGNNIKSNVIQLSDREMSQLVRDMALSYIIYGDIANNVVKNKLGQVAVVKNVDIRNLRSDKKNEMFYYSEDFSIKKSWRHKYEVTVLPAYNEQTKNNNNVCSTIYWYKNDRFSTYGHPFWEASIPACELEKSIDEYHLNSINNGFVGSVMVNLNNGVPDDEQKEEIEKNFNEKFTGKENAGRVVITYNNDKEHAAEIQKIDTEDFSERYKTLAERSRQTIFTTFKITAKLLGTPEDNIGFNNQEYKDSYALFYETTIKPIQKIIVDIINDIFDNENAVEIDPFDIKFSDGTLQNETIQ